MFVKTSILFLFSLIAITFANQPDTAGSKSQAGDLLKEPHCGAGEVAKNCGFDLTCENRDAKNNDICYDTKQCFCADGFVRNHGKRCIPAKRCKTCQELIKLRKCPKNEVPVCSGCDAVCVPVIPECVEVAFTFPECHCAENYVRNPYTGTCIPQDQCLVKG